MARDTLSRHGQPDDGSSIEFLTPNVGAFGSNDVADFVGFDGVEEPVFDDEEEPRSPWLAAIASIVVVGLLGAGVIAAAPWSNDDGAASPTTTVPTSTTRPAPTTTERVIDIAAAGDPGYLIDDTALELAGAWTVGAEYRPADVYGDDHFDLWASPDATRTTGQWLAISARIGTNDYEEIVPDAVRVPVGDEMALVAARGDGAVYVVFSDGEQSTFEVEAFGFALGDLMAIVGDVTRGDEGVIQYGPVAGPLLAGTTLEVSTQVPYGSLSSITAMWRPRAGVYYMGNNYQTSIDISVGEASAVPRAYDFLAPAVDLGVDDQIAIDAMARQGRVVTVRELKSWRGALLATWRDPTGSVQVQSYGLSTSALIAALASARIAEPLEWATLIDKSNRGEIVVDSGDESRPTVIAAQDGEDGEFYRIEIQPGPPVLVSMGSNRSGWGGLLGDIPSEPTVHRFASRATTFLVLTAEWPNTVRRARITVEGREPVELTMVQVGDSPVYAAGFAYADDLPANVEFLTDDGTVVANPDVAPG